jgi:hypothetical protein
MTSSCEHINNLSGSIQAWEFLFELSINFSRRTLLRRVCGYGSCKDTKSILFLLLHTQPRADSEAPSSIYPLSRYSMIISIKSLSLCMTIFSASLTNLTVFLRQSHDCSCYVSRRILAPPPLCANTLIYAHTTSRTLPNSRTLPISRTLPTFYISLGSLMLPAPEAGDFVDLLLL